MQVDFYLISNQVNDAAYKLASRLSSKLQKLDKNVLLVTNNTESSIALDKIMWSYSDTSFVAHEIYTADEKSAAKIFIAHAEAIEDLTHIDNFDVLINLSDKVLDCSHNFSRIAEIVEQDEAAKAQARMRFKRYSKLNFELKTHSIEL